MRSLPAVPYGVSSAILPPPGSAVNVVALTQATTPDSSWLPSIEVLTPRRCESIARPSSSKALERIVVLYRDPTLLQSGLLYLTTSREPSSA